LIEHIIDTLVGFLGKLLPFKWAQYEFMRRALLALLLTGPITGAMGVHVVNLRMSFFADAISHSAFAGIAVGLIIGIQPKFTLIGLALLVAFGIARLIRRTDLSTDTIIAIFFAGTVALGVAIISRQKAFGQSLDAFLFGDVIAVSSLDVFLAICLFIAVFAYLLHAHNQLIMIALDANLASAEGIRVELQQMLFSLLLAMTVAISINTVGILLVTAMLVVPAATARNLTFGAGSNFWWSVGIATAAGLLGVVSSFYFETATGATVVLFSIVAFIISMIYRWVKRR